MALREIIILPDKRLRLVSKPVEKVTPDIRKLADDMFETMYDAPGIGLAAIQIAEPLRLITMDLAKKDENGETKREPRVFINPEILSSSAEKSVYEEGCLSIPDYYEEVERPARVRLRFTDLDGNMPPIVRTNADVFTGLDEIPPLYAGLYKATLRAGEVPGSKLGIRLERGEDGKLRTAALG